MTRTQRAIRLVLVAPERPGERLRLVTVIDTTGELVAESVRPLEGRAA